MRRLLWPTGEVDTDRFLRRDRRHAILRKTLTPMQGVFRGYQTLLVLYAFVRGAGLEPDRS